MSAKPKIPRGAGRPVDPDRQDIFARYGKRKNVWEWDRRAQQCGAPPLPWQEGPVAVKAAIVRMGKDPPDWLIEVIASEQVGATEPDIIPDDFDGDHVAFMDKILSSLRRRANKALKAGGDSAILAGIAKDYAKIAAAREMAHKSARASDDGLVSLAEVCKQIDEMHAAIPDRIEGELIGAEADAKKALDAGTWRQFCGAWVNHALASLKQSFAETITRQS